MSVFTGPAPRSGTSSGAGSRSFDGLWSAIEGVGRVGSGGYRRFAWTAADLTLREWFAGEAAVRGLGLVEDRAGNQWAWWGDPDTRPGIVTGSHLDSVPDGGAYDGPLGVVSAFAAIDALRARGFEPQRPIGVVNFGDEEGARFGIACAGSRLITGALPAERALALRDGEGRSLSEVLTARGRDPRRLGIDREALGRIGTFVELHVEQGRQLVQRDSPVGVATDIWPHGRWRVELPGVADHAGTTALADRNDAMISCAHLVLAARSAAERHGVLATVGKIVVEPGGVNAIPSGVLAWLDCRGADQTAVRSAVAELAVVATELGGSLTEESWTPPTRFDAALATRVSEVLEEAPLLGTGAGHDAGILANTGILTAMVFVRNPTGVSHSPAEFAERDDCLSGVAALTTVLADLAGRPS